MKMSKGRPINNHYTSIIIIVSFFSAVIVGVVGRKKKHPVDAALLVQHMLENGPPPKRAPSDYWHSIAGAMCSTERPPQKFLKAVASTWYCNRHGVQDAYIPTGSYINFMEVGVIDNQFRCAI